MKRKVAGIGETLLDIVFREGKPVAAVPGGSTFNAMVSLGRTAGKRFPETELLMITRLGDDDVAEMVTSFMEENNISRRAVTQLEGSQTTISIASLDEHNNARYEFFRDNGSKVRSELYEPEFTKDDILLFGSFYAVSQADRAQVQKLLRAASEAGSFIYYDVNFRKSHLKDLPAVKATIEENCSLSDVVRASSEDLLNLYGISDPACAFDEYLSKFCKCFISTKGAEETEIFVSKGEDSLHLKLPVPVVDEVVTTIGAGDNFNAGFIYGLLEGGFDRNSLIALDEGQWRHLAAIANGFAANVCGSIYNYVDKDYKCW